MELNRRSALAGLSAAAIGFGGLKLLSASPGEAQPMIEGYGPLVRDPARLLDLPQGFSYAVVSREGEPMSDGLRTPAAFDAMAAFSVRGAPHQVALVRNHEMWPNLTAGGAFHAGGPTIAREKIFDFAADGTPKLGGTSTLVWDMRQRRVVRSHLSLAGTCGNCAGGATPWDSWLTCEETIEKDAPLVGRPHGWVFEVPSQASGLVDPVPLTAMGRLVHEAAAVDPRTGIVYLTEDRPDSLFYRFLPNRRGRLAEGGRLQALGLLSDHERDLRNWPSDGSRFAGQGKVLRVGGRVLVGWMDMDDVESPDGDLKDRGFRRGALRFARGEGLAMGSRRGRTEIYICCTMGGPERLGQVWRYVPSRFEGQLRERGAPGELQLFVESEDAARLKNCDNVAVTPWGDLILCEDGPDDQPQYLRGVTPEGRLYTLAANSYSEFAGACFSPDGRTMFVNAQSPGITLRDHGAVAADRLAAVDLMSTEMTMFWLAVASAVVAANLEPASPVGQFMMSYPFPSSDGATIVFQGNFDGRWQLYEMKASDGTIRRVHVSAADDTHPALSPDGKLLAFISNRDGNDDVWVLDLASGAARAVSPHPGKDGHPKWSPDGRRLIFNRTFDLKDTEGDLDSAIVEVDLGGGPVAVVSDTARVETFPSYSPDGRSVAFVEWFPDEAGNRNRNGEVIVVDLATKARRNLTNSPEFDGYPFWGPSGWIYFSTVFERPSREAVLSRVREDGGAVERIGAVDGKSEMRAIPAADERTVWFNRAEGGRGMIFRLKLGDPTAE